MYPRIRRRTSGVLHPACFFLVIAIVAAPGCASTPDGSSSTTPGQPVVTYEEGAGSVERLREVADVHFRQGEQAFLDGDEETADAHFDTAIEIFLEGEVPPSQEESLRWAFNDLMTRIQGVKLMGSDHPFDGMAPELPEESIPPLSIVEIEMLRSRLASTMPPLPRFTVPVPDPVDNPRVLEAIEYLAGDRNSVIVDGLGRAARWLPMIEQTFDEVGVPRELAWMPLIESLFKPWVRSRAGAVGMWQLMPGTARLFGMRVDWYVDERRDPVMATRVAARLLKELYSQFGDWHLSIASYNAGRGRVERALRTSGTNNFWDLAETRALPRETRDFVPKILAAIHMGTDPERFDLMFEPEPVFEADYEEVSIDTMTDLEVIAECAATSVDVIRELNPQLLRRTTPNVDSYTVRIPSGRRAAFEQAFAAIPPNERVFFVEHQIRRGESLSTIADGYDTSIAAIADLNNIRNRHRIRAGSTILVPVGQRDSGRVVRGSGSASLPAATASYQRGERVEHRVNRGENLSLIAAAYRTSVSNLRRWNQLRSDRIYPGDTLTVYYAGEGASVAVASDNDAAPATGGTGGGDGGTDESSEIQYVIRRGDTLSSIAGRYSVRISDITRWNGISSRTTLYPGNRLTLRGVTEPETTSYTVRRGDTLGSIAQRFGVSISDLCAWNGISSRKTLYPGDRLLVHTDS